MTLIASIAPKLSKLIPLLGSDKPGEVLGTVQAIRRTLGAAGCDLHDLARSISDSPSQREILGPNSSGPPQWSQLTDDGRRAWMQAVLSSETTSEWEYQFILQILRRRSEGRKPTPKQIQKLDEILADAWREGVHP